MRGVRPSLALAFVLASTVASGDTPKAAPKADPSALNDKATLLAPIQVDSLTITPIVATAAGAAATKRDVLVLDEGFAQKLVSIREKPDESVNQLTLTNSADRPLFLLAGEVIIGGKQDRIIGANTLIPAKSTEVVPVFCVEHGRWDEKTRDFTTAKALAHGRLRGRANYESQSEVWSEVRLKNEARKTLNPTDTYRRVATQQSDGTLAKSEKTVNDAIAKLPPADRARMIGYVVALNGKVATVDLFGSPELFKKLENKLVRSYLTEAVDIAAQKDIKPPSTADVKAFMFEADSVTAVEGYQNSSSVVRIQKGTTNNKATVKAKKPAAGEAGVTIDDDVYMNVQSK